MHKLIDFLLANKSANWTFYFMYWNALIYIFFNFPYFENLYCQNSDMTNFGHDQLCNCNNVKKRLCNMFQNNGGTPNIN